MLDHRALFVLDLRHDGQTQREQSGIDVLMQLQFRDGNLHYQSVGIAIGKIAERQNGGAKFQVSRQLRLAKNLHQRPFERLNANRCGTRRQRKVTQLRFDFEAFSYRRHHDWPKSTVVFLNWRRV